MGTPVKNMVVLGAAESGIGAAILGTQKGYEVFVSDGGTIKANYKTELIKYGIAFEEGQHSMDKLLQADLVIKSPGIPEKAPLMKALRAAAIHIISEVEFAYQYKGASKIIAITGSNGKSTTTKWVYYILEQGGLDVSIVGNIGISFARQVAEQPTAWYVLEVSSFQLDDIQAFRPDVAVLLNISPDHLDRYDYDINNYIASKFQITKNQTADDLFVTNDDDAAITNYLQHHKINAKTAYIKMSQLPNNMDGAYKDGDDIHMRLNGDQLQWSIHELTLKGRHNQYNSMAAGISANAAGVRNEKIRESLYSFTGLEHRLEHVGTVRGVTFINDSKATNVNAVWYALESMNKPTILILGGQDKGNDYSEIEALVKEKVKAIVCMGVDNTPILNYFSNITPTIIETQSAQDAVLAAYSLAEKDDVVLLSPACASFDLFQNYEHRGAQFKEAVKNL